MTDEERQKLCEDLDGISHDEKGVDDYVAERCLAAADEIKRLAKEVEHWKMIANRAYIDPKPLAQPNAEPQDDGIIRKIKKLEQEIAELTPEQRAVFDTKIKSRSDAAKAAITQSNAEPQEIVEARKRVRECTSWHDCQQCSNDEKIISEYEAASPRPDASAGLIEAAEIAEEWDSGWGEDRNTRVARQTAIEIAEALRARAADTSEK